MDLLEKLSQTYEQIEITRGFTGVGVGLVPVYMSTTIPMFSATGKTVKEALTKAHNEAQAWRVVNGYTEYWGTKDDRLAR